MSTLLSVKGLSAGYGDIKIIDDVHIEVGKGSIVTIVGPNGAGKSTLLKAIYGLARTMGGSAEYSGVEPATDLVKLRTHQLAKIGVGYVPQIENIFPELTIDENLQLGNMLTGSVDRRDEMYERYPDLASRKNERAGHLSGGQRQMLALARALMASPKLLLLDEPSAGLAPALVDQLFDELVAINKTGVTMLMVEQNARRALEISDHGYVLDMGKNRHEGPGTTLASDPAVVGIYFGKKR